MMKRLFLFLTLLYLAGVGCGKQRDTLTPKRALCGHWRDREGVEWYLAAGGKCTIDRKGDRQAGRYDVNSQNPIERKIKFKVTTEGGRIYLCEGKFSRRFQEYSGEVKICSRKVSSKKKTEEFNWVFIDCQTAPGTD